MARRRPVALDHNVPRPILDVLARFMPEVSLTPVRDIHPGLVDLEDHDLIYELARQRWTLMVTGNYRMLNDPSVLVALHQTRMTLFTIEGAGHDAILTTGTLLRDLVPAIKRLSRRGQIFRSKPTAPTPTRAYELLTRHAAQTGRDPDDVRREHHVPNWRAGPRLLQWPS